MKPVGKIVTALIIGSLAAGLEAKAAAGRDDALAAVAADPQGGAPAALAGAQAALEQAIVALESRRSISARMLCRVDLFGKQLEGEGRYLEQRTVEGLQFRLELRFPVGDEPVELVHACNGRHLWKYEKSQQGAQVARVDVARVARALEEKGELPRPGRIGDWPGLGGLPRLLRRLNLRFDFGSPEATTLSGGFATLRLVGRWKPKELAALLPEQRASIEQGAAIDLGALPPQVPHEVALFLGKDDLFPYRVEYWRRDSESPAAMIVAVELFKVNLNVPIGAEEFQYDPGTLEFSEQTDRFVESLGR